MSSKEENVFRIDCTEQWKCNIFIGIIVGLLLMYGLCLFYLIRKLKSVREKLEKVKLEKIELQEESNQLQSEIGVWNG